MRREAMVLYFGMSAVILTAPTCDHWEACTMQWSPMVLGKTLWHSGCGTYISRARLSLTLPAAHVFHGIRWVRLSQHHGCGSTRRLGFFFQITS